jgi:hypothetical protein
VTEHRCQTVIDVGGKEIILTSWQPGKVKDCAICKAKRPRSVKLSGES